MIERFGKFCFFQKTPLVFLILLLTPICLAFCYFFSRYTEITDLEDRFYVVCKKMKSSLEKKEKKEQFIQRYKASSPYFLDEQIESISFLEEEKKHLQNLLQHPAIVDKRPIESRLQFLASEGNRFVFTEEAIKTNASMKETEEKQRHPVQMSPDDVKKTLSLLEDLPIENYGRTENRPQIVITDFLLQKKQTSLKTDVFEVDMQFIKREFFP